MKALYDYQKWKTSIPYYKIKITQMPEGPEPAPTLLRKEISRCWGSSHTSTGMQLSV